MVHVHDRGKKGSALHAEDLLQRGDDLDQVGLLGHDEIDVLVGAGDLIDHGFIYLSIIDLQITHYLMNICVK